jgi:transcriptional regulator with XRE-family HTH domain
VQNDVSKRFRENLRMLRENRGLTQYQAAELCGIGQKLYQAYETGSKDNPGLKTLQKIAEAFGIEVYDLLTPMVKSAKRPKK